MKYKICVAIPIKSEVFNTNKKLIETALDNSPDLIEFRFDYINKAELCNVFFVFLHFLFLHRNLQIPFRI